MCSITFTMFLLHFIVIRLHSPKIVRKSASAIHKMIELCIQMRLIFYLHDPSDMNHKV